MCGGAQVSRRALAFFDGLSPRVRGSQFQHYIVQVRQGSIPACAGEPGTPGANGKNAGVYPRVCGGTG